MYFVKCPLLLPHSSPWQLLSQFAWPCGFLLPSNLDTVCLGQLPLCHVGLRFCPMASPSSWKLNSFRIEVQSEKIPMRNSMKRPECHYWALPLAAGAQGVLTILPPLSPRPRADLVKNRWSPFSHVAFLCQVEEAWNKVVDNLLFSSLQGLSGTEFHPKVWTFKSPLPWDVQVRRLEVGLLL